MTVTSRKNEKVRLFRELSREKKQRDSLGLFAAEGDHLCGELVAEGYTIRLALCTERAAQRYPETVKKLSEQAQEYLVINEELAEYISDTKAPQGLFAVAEKPAMELREDACKAVVLDGVQDPGNVGTVIRTAEALGIDAVVLLGGCADVWSPKTLRSSMGSALRLPCVNGDVGTLSALKESGFALFGAMLDDTAKRLGEFGFPEKSAVVIGSEGGGISRDVADILDNRVYIPISGAESLNAAVAAAIILWELAK